LRLAVAVEIDARPDGERRPAQPPHDAAQPEVERQIASSPTPSDCAGCAFLIPYWMEIEDHDHAG